MIGTMIEYKLVRRHGLDLYIVLVDGQQVASYWSEGQAQITVNKLINGGM